MTQTEETTLAGTIRQSLTQAERIRALGRLAVLKAPEYAERANVPLPSVAPEAPPGWFVVAAAYRALVHGDEEFLALFQAGIGLPDDDQTAGALAGLLLADRSRLKICDALDPIRKLRKKVRLRLDKQNRRTPAVLGGKYVGNLLPEHDVPGDMQHPAAIVLDTDQFIADLRAAGDHRLAVIEEAWLRGDPISLSDEKFRQRHLATKRTRRIARGCLRTKPDPCLAPPTCTKERPGGWAHRYSGHALDELRRISSLKELVRDDFVRDPSPWQTMAPYPAEDPRPNRGRRVDEIPGCEENPDGDIDDPQEVTLSHAWGPSGESDPK